MSIISELQHDHTELESVYNYFGLRIVTSSSLKRVYELGASGFAIISAFRPEFETGDRVNYKRSRDAGMKERPHLQNFERYKRLQERLRHFNIGYVTLVGQWRDNPDDPVHEELSCFIPYKNAADVVFKDNPFEFHELAMLLSKEFEQTAFVFCPPPAKQGTAEVYCEYTGLNRSSESDSREGDRMFIGSFHIADVQDLYLSILLRANKSNRVAWKFDSPSEVPETQEDGLLSANRHIDVGIQWKRIGWAGASVYAQHELLWLLDQQEQNGRRT